MSLIRRTQGKILFHCTVGRTIQTLLAVPTNWQNRIEHIFSLHVEINIYLCKGNILEIIIKLEYR